MNTLQISQGEITPQQITSVISGLIALASAVFTSYMAAKQKKKEKDAHVEISDREQNRELVKNLQESDRKKQEKIDEMDSRILELYASYQSLLKENTEVNKKLSSYEAQKETWQRERETWQGERENWQAERRQHELEKKTWEIEREAWHTERKELVAKIKNLESQIQDLQLRINRRYDEQF